MLIGFSGKKGSGKTCAANYLVKNYSFKLKSFATPLREQAKNMFGFKDSDFSLLYKEKPFLHYDWCPREFMTHLGQFMRYHDPEYWINRIGLDKVYNYCVDDLRFKNEAKHIKNMGGILIRIERYKSFNPYAQGDMNTDISEVDLDNAEFDYTVDASNNVTLEDLYKMLDKIMATLGKKKT